MLVDSGGRDSCGIHCFMKQMPWYDLKTTDRNQFNQLIHRSMSWIARIPRAWAKLGVNCVTSCSMNGCQKYLYWCWPTNRI